ncbi:MAG: hypothetical protein AMJ67_13220 [Betaproteobacteria bacterium SG8_41]|nr:MAG: hypothetical protein AMJ67_13220 [Betaproteobacteria bacterium SG8_41]
MRPIVRSFAKKYKTCLSVRSFSKKYKPPLIVRRSLMKYKSAESFRGAGITGYRTRPGISSAGFRCGSGVSD